MTPDPITRLNAALEGRYRVERELAYYIWSVREAMPCEERI